MQSSINRQEEQALLNGLHSTVDQSNQPEEEYDAPADRMRLSEDEVREAQERIRRLHPLNVLRVSQVFPTCCCCIRRCRKNNDNLKSINNRKEDEKKTLERLKNVMEDLGINDQELRTEDIDLSTRQDQNDGGDDQSSEDAYLSLGFGICAYFNMIRTFIFTFFILTLLSIPVMFCYHTHQGLLNTRNYERSQFSLGNMGFSQTTCLHFYLGLNVKPNYYCKVGKISQLYAYGLIPNDLQSNNSDLTYCGVYNAPEAPAVISKCENIKIKDFIYHFNDTCVGKQSCNLNLTLLKVQEDSQFLYKNSPCIQSDSRFYIQYGCLQDKDILNVKRGQGLTVACLGIFMCFVFLMSIFYLSSTAYIDYKLWDVFTVTAADFTVEFTVTNNLWAKFCMMPESNMGESSVVAFEAYLKREFEKILELEPSVLSGAPDQTKIANISFAFDNPQIIALLKQRGDLVTAAKYDKLPNIDKKINNLKEDEFYSLNRPVTAFITFETQEGYERACNIKGKKGSCGRADTSDKEFLDEPLMFREACEPTNIIWENRHLSSWNQLVRKIFVGIFITIILLLALAIFFVLKQLTIENQKKYPPSRACDEINSLFSSAAIYLKYATIDKNSTRNNFGAGVYQCYCTQDQYQKDSICDDYRQDLVGGTTLSTVVSVSVVIINLILRAINMKVITLIRYHTESEQTKAIMTSIFFSTFLNTAILCLLTNANTSQTILRFLSFLVGSYPDVTFEWYIDVGPAIVQTMFINAIMPIIEFGYSYPFKWLFRICDRGCRKDSLTTRKRTIQQYVNLHAGPLYLIHFKYSSIMNTTFVTFMYGLALPVLFPIALLALLIIYAIERLTLSYYYKKPPMYDEKMNAAALSMLKWAPLTMVLFGYWTLGNKQIFSNIIDQKQRLSDPLITHHDIWDREINQSTPLLIFIFVFFVGIFLNDLLMWVLTKIRCCNKKSEDEVDEKLGSYFECLTLVQRKSWAIEEKFLQNVLGIYTLDEYAINKLKNSKSGSKIMQDCFNYEILSNPKYQDMFQFTPLDMRDTYQEQEASEQILKILLMAYCSKDRVQQYQFRNTYIEKGKKKKVVKKPVAIVQPPVVVVEEKKEEVQPVVIEGVTKAKETSINELE